MTKNPVVDVAKKQDAGDRERVLSTGVRIRVAPVSASLIMEVQNGIPYPPVPIVVDEEKGQTYENPNHPAYIRAVNDVETSRAMAAMDAVIMFGVELLDGMPQDDMWLRKLKVLDKRTKSIGLEYYDLNDEVDLEFLYKKHVAVSSDDYDIINSMVGVTDQGVEEIEDSFPGNA